MKLEIRSAGVLLHPTSLPGPGGIGDLGPSAHGFARTLAQCRQSWWQMLPIVPPGMGESPYNAISAFAGNPLLLSLETLAEEGLLSSSDVATSDLPEDHVDFGGVERFKWPRLKKAFAVFESKPRPALRRAFEGFCARERGWLEDFSLFSALRRKHSGAPWTQWEDGLRRRESGALAAAQRDLDAEVRLHRFLQFQFDRQWRALRSLCHDLGVGLIGDVPIFVAHDSADVWSHPELFWLDRQGRPLKVAGVPPDYFSKTGQLWGNPIYRWDAMRREGFAWWIERLRSAFSHFDAVRLDHFIGFHNYWEIPAGETTAVRGRWVLAPGAELFSKVEKKLGPLQLIAEDLGVVTPEVRALRDRFGFPGLRVLQMAFGTDLDADSYKPHNYPRGCVVYPGTHDNDTAQGWFNDQSSVTSTRTSEEIRRERAAILRYLGTDGNNIHWDLIRLALSSVANTAIVSAQDLLGLDSKARMNLPGSAQGNWLWRLKDGALTPEIQELWTELTETFGRASSFSETSKRRKAGVRPAAIKISTPPKATT